MNINRRNIIIWGFGGAEESNVPVAKATDRLHDFLVARGMWEQVLFCVDSNESRHGLNRHGLQTYAPAKAKEQPEAVIIVNSNSHLAIARAAREMGLANELLFVPPQYYHNYIEEHWSASSGDGQTFYPYMLEHMAAIRAMYDQSDQVTRAKLDVLAQLADQGREELQPLSFYGETSFAHSYFCDESLAPSGEVTLVDVGAYIGDSIEPVRKFYGERFRQCYAFEPEEENRRKLEAYLTGAGLSGRSEVRGEVLGNRDGMVSFEQNADSSVLSETGSIRVPMRRFDDLYHGHTGTLMIKMDIEGAELSALRGMERVLREQRPYLAVCVYHKLGDILEIPRWLRSVCPGYRFYLRGGWHLECWGVPE